MPKDKRSFRIKCQNAKDCCDQELFEGLEKQALAQKACGYIIEHAWVAKIDDREMLRKWINEFVEVAKLAKREIRERIEKEGR